MLRKLAIWPPGGEEGPDHVSIGATHVLLDMSHSSFSIATNGLGPSGIAVDIVFLCDSSRDSSVHVRNSLQDCEPVDGRTDDPTLRKHNPSFLTCRNENVE